MDSTTGPSSIDVTTGPSSIDVSPLLVLGGVRK
jgi:hypothetical protein